MHHESFKKIFFSFIRFSLVALIWGTQFMSPQQSTQAAPALDPEAAPVMDTGMPRPHADIANLFLTKTIDGNITSADVGDTIFYRIRFQCSSLTTDCGELEITDTLSSYFTYLPSESYAPSGYTMTESAGTVTITKDDNLLLDGSQADAVIAVRVNYDARPLPATVDNQAVGRVKPPSETDWLTPVTADAPSIDIGTVSPDWTLTKTLYSPSIPPTVDTNVTYQLRLCPNSTSGNVELTNVQIIDTLPSGVEFVSASDGGVESAGVVTWDITGPIAPPTCATRYVTIRFNSADGFTTSSTGLTNSANATGDYEDNAGDPCPDCYGSGNIDETHDIQNIVEGVHYSKNDAGDPVGITGTARFTLNLDTDATNYPADEVTLIDHLPPQLKVMQITSGAWAQELDGNPLFDIVRATVQYSTYDAPDIDTPSEWTTLGLVDYNDNTLYDTLPDNITAVRWDFEHDSDHDSVWVPGLPFDWSFSNSPQIRVTPRDVDVNTTDGVTLSYVDPTTLPQTYDNCLQARRRDSNGILQLGTCDIEDMTVQGDFVSLRTTKNETPGASYDIWDDPNINTFTADTTILPNDTLRYTISVDVTERSSAPLNGLTIQDTLPAGLIFVRQGDITFDGNPLPATGTGYDVEASPTFTQSGQDLTWTWNNSTETSPTLYIEPLEYGSHTVTVEIFARVPPGTLPQDYVNTLYSVTDSDSVICEVGSTLTDGSDLDSDSNTAETVCQNTDSYKVERSAALRGEKWIRSIDPDNAEVIHYQTFTALPLSTAIPLPANSCPDGGIDGITSIATNHFTRYPCVSQAYPEGALGANEYVPPTTNPNLDDFEYNLRIFNEGNVPMLEYVLYDILPYFGDTGSGGVLTNSARESEFRPALTGPIQFIQGPGSLASSDFLIEYSQSTNPCRPEVFDEAAGASIPSGCTDDWTSTTTSWTANDWAAVRAYRIELITNEIEQAVPAGNELRFGVPMSILEDAPPDGFTQDDAQTREIAWNSFSHVGSYDKDAAPGVQWQDLLASEPRKVGITIPERLSIGNRVWRDSDNSGTVNAPDDTDPGIGGVVVNLYLASNTSVPIASTITDTAYTDANGYHAAGYYLFSNLPEGNYVVGIPASNFGVGAALEGLRSSTGAGASPVADYTNPPDSTGDQEDHGIDPAIPGLEVFSDTIVLTLNAEETGESYLSDDDADGLDGARRGVNAETDESSDLTVDFGFFGGTDVPFSIGNHVWKDNGAISGHTNNGIFDADETPVVGARVELYRDGNLNGTAEAIELIRFDVTDTNGFYLFDNLDPGNYYVKVAAGNFGDTAFDPDGSGAAYSAATPVLQGWFSSQVPDPANAEAGIDSNDDGIDTNYPETYGVLSSVVILERDAFNAPVPEPTGETHLSGDIIDAGFGNNPTAWDGPDSRGRYSETDASSNLTVDFGFIPPMSIGNHVWFDSGSTTTGTDINQYNDGIMNGDEPGVVGVRVVLLDSSDTIIDTTDTDANGYYLFERVQPGDYKVKIIADNFSNVGSGDVVAGDPLANYISSVGSSLSDSDIDLYDDGIDDTSYLTNGIVSSVFTMDYDSEPVDDADHGPDVHGNYGQEDNDSNLSIDFGFIAPPRSIGNRLWFDDGGTGSGTVNNGILDGDEAPVVGAQVSLYLDADNNGTPDGAAIRTDLTDANGYYLFDNLPPARYLVGVDADNFNNTGVGDTLIVLDEYTSSTGNVDNASNNTDSRDNGIDRVEPGNVLASPYGVLSTTINLTANPLTGLLTGETGSGDTTDAGFGNNPTAWDGTNSRGRYGETDANSDLTIDFGFFEPMSIGNRVFYDDGTGGGTLNNGIMDAGELPIENVRVELYLDDGDDTFDSGDTLVYWDITDSEGYYLFDNLTPDDYFVHIPAGNFNDNFDHDSNGSTAVLAHGALQGWYSSALEGTEISGTDVDDNGVNDKHPEVNGITSGLLTLGWDSEPITESQFSNDITNPNDATADDYDPTSWDGLGASGRWNESDDNSNLTIDFGFIPPLSLGNRVWLDEGQILASPYVDLTQFNNGVMDGAEAGVENVTLNLYYDADGDDSYDDVVDGVDEANVYRTTTTDASGYYLFDGLPEGKFYVEVTASNFGSSGALEGYQSSEDQVAFDDETADLNDNGEDDTSYLTNGISSRTFTLVYTSMPTDDNDIPASNPTNVAAYGADRIGRFGEVDSSSNLTLDFGFVQTHSLGNRVWRDSDNSGTINAVDDANPGIASVTLNLYAGIDAGNDGIPDDMTILATTTTDSAGYYLFDNLPAGDYIVGIPASNFATTSDALYGLHSSTGTPSSTTYTNPPESNPDSADHGIDTTTPPTASTEVFSHIVPLGDNEPAGESDLPDNTSANRTLYGDNLRGRYGETDATSDLTVDFGFFGGSDVPFSIGNYLWYDDGLDAGGNVVGTLNDGLRQAGELPVVGATVYLYRDGNANGTPDAGERLLSRSDVTDSDGFYLFDNLDPGTYFVQVTPANFADTGVLAGWYSSQPTGTETQDLDLDTSTDQLDQDDNGVNTDTPELNGVFSGAILLVRGTDEPLLESHLSNDSSVAVGFDPTAGDGTGHIGRFGETDATSNMTIDFGFIPPMSVGNRVWIDDGADGSGGVVLSEYNDGVMSATEAGVAGVRVELWRDSTFIRYTTTDATGYYLFDRLQPADNYYIHVADDNFGNTGVGDLVPGDPLQNYVSSFDGAAAPTDDDVDINDKGIDDANPLANSIISPVFEMSYENEPVTPTDETDISADTGTYGVGNVGLFGQTDVNSNLTLDFGFVQPRSVGNWLWFDTNNNGQFDASEQPVPDGVVVSLYQDANGDGTPDGAALRMDTTVGGYYLFDNLAPTGYVIAVDANNFASTGNLFGYFSSTTTVNNASNNTDSRDNGIDSTNPAGSTYGILSATIDLSATSGYPTSETGSGDTTPGDYTNNPTNWDGPNSRGRYGELDAYSDLTIDFGFYKVEIGNLVYRDENANGTYDSGTDVLLDGVTVKLYDTSDNEIASTTTNASGEYLFTNLPAGDYVVKVTTPTGLVSTIDSYDQSDSDDPDVGTDNNDNGVGVGYDTRAGQEVPSETLTMSAGEGTSTLTDVIHYNQADGVTTDNSLDFGFTYAYAIGNRVWFDTDNGSDIDAGEIGIDGVTVELYLADGAGAPTGAALATTTTASGDEAGYYLFDYLTADEYVVVIPASNFSGVLEGYWSSATEMLANGTLSETRATGNSDDQTDLDDNGLLVSGDVVSVAIAVGPTGLSEPTTDDDLRVGTTEDSTQPDGRSDLSVDFGFYKTEIGNLVFNDNADKNGIFNGTDLGIDGVTMELYTLGANGAVDNGASDDVKIGIGVDGIYGTADDAGADYVTSGGGLYKFTGLPEGEYYIRAGGQANYTSTIDTYPDNTSTDVTDPDTNVDNNDNGVGTGAGVVSSAALTMDAAETATNIIIDNASGTTTDNTLDFGFLNVYALGNRVWFDTNNNATMNAGEVGVNGVDVQLYADTGNGTGTPTGVFAYQATTTTANGGYYLFDYLDAGDYKVVIPLTEFGSGQPLEGYYSSQTAMDGTGAIVETTADNADTDNDDDDDNGTLNLDAVNFPDAVISAPITLGTGASEPTGETDLDSGDFGNQPDAQSNMTVDFGFYKVKIGNLVYLDDNADGTYVLADDTLLDGVTVELLNGVTNAVIDTTTTSSGVYAFDGLPAGDYRVRVTTPTTPEQLVSTIDTNPQNDNDDPDIGADNNDNGVGTGSSTATNVTSNLLTLSAGESTAPAVSYNQADGTTTDNSLDFGFTYAYALGNRVWFDTDNSATINGSEVGVANVTVQLYAASDLTTMLATTTTDASGYYLFDYLTADDYVVVIPAAEFASGGDLYGYWSSTTLMQADGTTSETTAPDPDDAGTDAIPDNADDDVDSDDNGTLQTGAPFSGGVISQAVTLGSTATSEPTGESDLASSGDGDQPDQRANMKVDFGFYKTEIGNLVFGDVDKDGAYSTGDTLLENILVQLFVTNGSTTTEIVTGADGILGTADDAWGPDGINGNGDDGTGGILTNASGNYTFSGLPGGDASDSVQYIVRVTSPAGSASTNDNANLDDTTTTGPDANIDDNDNGQGTGNGVVTSGDLTMTPGDTGAQSNTNVDDSTGTTSNPTVDFGFTTVYALGNRVWYDTDNDAVLDFADGEVGVDGVLVQLYADTGNGVSTPTGTFVDTGLTTVTANGGYYLFDGLESGHYRVVIPADNFDTSGTYNALVGYWSSQTSRDSNGILGETTAASPETNLDSDDNGTLDGGGDVVSQTVILGLAPSATEPTLESDTDASAAGALHQGNQPDNQANMTVDFGFYTISLGDLVWDDVDNSGQVNAETGIDDVTVELYAVDASGNATGSALASVITGSGAWATGEYHFTGLPAGDYILRIPAAEFEGTETLRDYVTSTGAANAYEPAPDADVDTTNDDDNGSQTGGSTGLGGYIQSEVVTLTPKGEDTATSDNAIGFTNEPRVDFGVYKNPLYNLSITKSDGDGNAHYLPGGTIKYTIVITNNGPADVSGATVTDTFPASITAASWTCAGTGSASCTASGTGNISDSVNIPYGENVTYSVTATVSATATGDIVNTASVEDPDGHVESDDHTDQESSMTVTKDDSYTVVSPGSEITYTIVVENTGDVDLTDLTITDTLPAEVDFVSASDSGTEAAGVVTWDHTDLQPLPGADTTLLAPGETKTVTVTVRVKDEADLGSASSITNTVTASDTNGSTDTDDDTDTLARENVKTLIETNHAATIDPIVTIGEILTYRVSLTVPAGVTMTNVKAVDNLDAGLAFVDCAELNAPADGKHDLVVSSADLSSSLFTFADDGFGNLTAACAHGTNIVSSNPLITTPPSSSDPDAGREFTLNLGTLTNADTSNEQTIELTYRVAVLDIAQNSNGTDELNNLITWTWDGGELSGEATPVEIIEPDMDIDKTAETPVAPLGSTIPFSIDIYHTDISTANAYDVVITDVLPEALEYVDGSASLGSPIPYDSFDYDAATRTITIVWDSFPLYDAIDPTQKAHTTITFDTLFVGPAPVTNEANVAWTSLPIDPQPDGTPEVQSDYNDDSTERWYDPADTTNVDDYERTSSVEINRPPLPATGFAPNRITSLPEQNAASTYQPLSGMWLEIPTLGTNLPIVGVPLNNTGWDLTWLGGQAGYLEGTAYPGLPGNTVITGHVYLPNGAPGPFVDLQKVYWGTEIVLHANGQRYTYQVRSQRKVFPNDLSAITHEEYDWITLLTCQGYDEEDDSYAYRIAVRAVLIDVQPE